MSSNTNPEISIRKYTTNERVGRPRILPEDTSQLTHKQRQRRLWNEKNKEHLRIYNKKRREEKKLLKHSEIQK